MWQKRAGHEHDHIDARTGVHHIHLHNPHTDGQHLLHIHLGVDECPTCGRPHACNGLDKVDPAAYVAEAIAVLEANHQHVLDYAAKHRLAIKVGPNASMLAGHQTLEVSGEHKIISAPRVLSLEDGNK